MVHLSGAQRIVVFIGSPVVEDEKTLTKIGKLLKKNNVRAIGYAPFWINCAS